MGTTLYGLLARSSALVTDYSSVWTDYLTLDRPIAFIIDVAMPSSVVGTYRSISKSCCRAQCSRREKIVAGSWTRRPRHGGPAGTRLRSAELIGLAPPARLRLLCSQNYGGGEA